MGSFDRFLPLLIAALGPIGLLDGSLDAITGSLEGTEDA